MKIKQMMAIMLTAVMTISSLPMGSLQAYAAENEPAIESVADPADTSDPDGQSVESEVGSTDEIAESEELSEAVSEEGSSEEISDTSEVTESVVEDEETEAVTSEEETAEVLKAKEEIKEVAEDEADLLYLTDAERTAYEAAASNILNEIAVFSNAEEKILYIHDYIVTHCEIDLTNATGKDTAYAALVGGSSNSKGYSYAFKDLVSRAGIDADVVHSETLGHYWNRVKIGENYYYVDVTNDDSLAASEQGGGHYYEMYCSHDLVLCSADALNTLLSSLYKKDSHDWKVNGVEVFGMHDDNDVYASAFWHDSEHSPLAFMGTYCLYIDSLESNIMKYDFPKGTTEIMYDCSELDGWMHSGNWGTIQTDGTFVFFNDGSDIYRFEEDTKTVAQVNTGSLFPEEAGDYNIFGIRLLTDEDKIEYWVATDISDNKVVKNDKIDISDIYSSITRVKLDKKVYKFTSPGDTAKLTATVTGPDGDVSWKSSDTSVVSVDDSGNITALKYGSATIEASVGTAKASCAVWVDTTWQNDYDFYAEGDQIILNKYTGSAATVTVREIAFEGGLLRHTVLGYTQTYTQTDSSASPTFRGNTKITSVKIEPGVRFKEDNYAATYAFEGCSSLTSVDFGDTPKGVDFKGITSTYGMFKGCSKLTIAKFNNCNMSTVKAVGYMFKNCTKLETLDLQGCILSGLSADEADNKYMLNGCSGLKDIWTPAERNNAVNIDLPKAMVLYKDGQPQSDEYKLLNKAPVNSRIILKSSTPKTDISAGGYTLTIDKASYPYTGSEIKPAVTITKDADGSTLKEGTDFTVSYENNTNPGTAVLSAKGIGSYKGTLYKEFKIIKGEQTINIDLPDKLTVGRSIQVEVTGAKGNITYSVSPTGDPEGEATITEDGKLTTVKIGFVEITVNCAATDQYEAATAHKNLEIIDKPAVGAPVFTESPKVIKEEEGKKVVERNTLVSLSTDVAGADIYYTLDGYSDPDKAAYDEAYALGEEALAACKTKKYAGAIVIDEEIKIKAIAYKDGYKNENATATETYTVYEDLGDFADTTEDPVLDYISKHSGNYPLQLWYFFRVNGSGNFVYDDTYAVDPGAGTRTYTGDKITFNEDIYVFYGSRRLIENRDYTVGYSNNIRAGSANDENVKKRPAVTIKGKGNYSGSQTVYFTIEPAPIGDAELTSVELTTVTPNTAVSKAVPQYSYNGKMLKLGKDYAAEYREAGGEWKPVTKNDKFAAGKVYEVRGVDYDEKNGAVITYEGDFDGAEMDSVTVKVIDKTKEVQVSTLKVGDAKGKSVKIAYSGIVTDPTERSNYYTESGAVILNRVFGDSGYEPLAFVYAKKPSEPLVYGKDYYIDVVGAKDAGKYTAIIHGMGDKYIGDKKFTFEILGTPASKVKVAGLMTTAQYDGKAFTVVGDVVDSRLFNSSDKTAKAANWTDVTLYTVTGSSKTPLIPGTDYSTHIGNATHMGKVDVIFTLKGKYSGTIKKTVTIKAYDLTKGLAQGGRFKCEYIGGTDDYDAIYSKGGARIPGIKIYDDKGTTEDNSDDLVLIEGVDYTVSYKNDTVITPDNWPDYEKIKIKPTVTIKGKGNYTGSKGFWYRISKAELTKDNVSMTVKDKVYKKKAGKNYFKVTPVFTDGDKALTTGKNKDITVTDIRYRYAEDCKLDNGTERFAGQEIPAADVVPEGAVIEVSCYVEVKADDNAKSNYKTTSSPIAYKSAYRILPAGMDISKAKVSIDKDSKAKLTYTNGYNVPMSADDFVLKVSGKQLPAGTYKIKSVKNNRFIGTATVVFEGLDPYGGTKSYTFKIGAKSLK